MTQFSARFFDGKSSAATVVDVLVLDQTLLEIRSDGNQQSFAVSDCTFEAPLGNTRRIILLPDNGRLETDDFDTYDSLQDSLNPGLGLKWTHWLERKWRWVLASFACLVVFTIALFIWGVPWAAHVVAHSIPVEAINELGAGTLESMDEYFMDPSHLSVEERAQYLIWFSEISKDFPNEHSYHLYFRSSELGANAFALPDGSIVFTDEIIELMSGKEEFQAVAAHEIGHVIHRHSMQMVLRDTGIFIFISAFLGDVASVSSLTSAIPTLLIENSYSRSFEKEADLVSGEWLQKTYGSPDAMKSILIKLNEGAEGISIPELLSTHPDLHNRIMLLEETFSLPEDSEEQ